MLRPFLIIGVGGSGGKTIRGLRHALELRLEQADWRRGIPAAWQMIHIDTPLVQDGADYGMPFIPADDYKGLVAGGGSYDGVHSAIVYGKKIADEHLKDVTRQLPDAARVPVDVTKGAGQYRAVGRAVALSKLAEIDRAAQQAINRMTDASALGELATLGQKLGAKSDGGATTNPTVIIISSIAGGSGAGQYLDVIEAVKAGVKTQPWAHQFFAMLYAPDVFDQIKGSAGISSNALATVSETMNGFWNQNPSPATIELYRSKGLSPSVGGARDRVGAAYPFIIGRRNSRVTFDNQGEVYSAVATSIAAWVTDDKVQGDIDEYVTGNWAANVGASVLPDATRLMQPLDQSPPFSALGFGRLSLGREKFLDYSGERFARSVIDRMLFAHTEEDPQFQRQTEDEWIQERKNQAFESFIKATRLDEETEARNDVIDALRPTQEGDRLAAEFRNEVAARSSEAGTLDKSGGLDLSTWQHRLLTNRDDRINTYVARCTVYRQEKLTDWLERMPDHILDTVNSAIATQGLPVTVELLRELARVLKSTETNLLKEADERRGWRQRLAGWVNDDLAAAANQDSIRPEQDAVETALNRIADSFEWETEALLRDTTSQLLTELRRDFIEPLRTYLSSARDALLARVSEHVRADGRENDYEFWPKRRDTIIPRKYTPAPNERLLVAHTDYPNEFDRLVRSSQGNAKFDDAMMMTIESLIVGPSADEDIPEADRWRTVSMRRSWIPAVSADPGQKTAHTQLPRFESSNDPESYIQRSKVWMLRKGTAFDSYIKENLLEYFDADELDPAEFQRRKDQYRESLATALGTSEPLVRLNPALLSEVHGKSVGEGTRLVFSAIPFPQGSEMYEITKATLTGAGLWDENVSKGWFKDAKVSSIDIFAMSGFPFQPIVMDSIMEPIAKGWLAQSTNAESRAAFWKWKRARLLREAVPADGEVFDGMLRGWYVAKALGQLTVDDSDPDKGPKLGVWDAERRGYAWFPHPLLYPGSAPSHDFPGVIMESLIIAMALVNAETSLAPLRAYHVLLDLGGKRNELSGVLTQWLRSGMLPEACEPPSPERAGSATGDLAERQDAVRAFLDNELLDFRNEVVRQDSQTSVYVYPVSWEIRKYVEASLREIRDGVLETMVAKSGI